MKWIWITFLALISDSHSIQTRIKRPVRFVDQKAFSTRNFRHIDASSNIRFDWEHELREATVQALFREHVGDHNLRNHVYSAPLLGKQDKATPFGDIAVLARGQLYANYAGYIFVQDPYQNDCDECHNIDAEAIRGRCINDHCQIWHPRSNEELIALWSIKRIRHRSSRDGYNKLEIEFTVSPVGIRRPKKGYLTKEGTFNYNIPGHMFILKSSEVHQNPNSVQNVNPLKQGAFIAQTPDGRKYILHSFSGILTPETPRYQTTPKDYLPTGSTSTTEFSEDDAKKVYQTLLEVLHKKTSIEPHRFPSPTQKTSTTISDTTLVQFPDGQVVPITELETPFVTKTTPGYVTVRFPETSRIPSSERPKGQSTAPSHFLFKPSPPDEIPKRLVPTTAKVRPQNIPTTKQTTPYDFPAASQHTTFVASIATNRFTTETPTEVYNKPRPIYSKPTTVNTILSPQYNLTTQGVALTTTKAPVKMTFHFFAAEEEKKITPVIPQAPITIPPQEHFTENRNFLPDTVTPTEPTNVFSSESTKYEIKTTPGLEEPTIRSTFTTINGRPATIVRITKPITESTYFSSKTTPSYHTTEPSTKIPHSMPFEPSTTPFYITKKPYSDFSIPITVLEDTTSTGTTSEEKYPPTSIETAEPTLTTNGIKYTSTQFYVPTTKLVAAKDSTTLRQETSTALKGKVPTKKPTIDTTYEKPLTLVPVKKNIETTLGTTTIMGTSQNKTTEMVYYAAEETDAPTKHASAEIPPTRFADITSSFIGSTVPTTNKLETETISTPKRIVTTIRADGTVSVKTTPFYIEDELFGLTKGSTKNYKTTKSYKVSTTEASDFLVENGFQQSYNLPPLFNKKPVKDYREDDIFGSTKSTHAKSAEKTSVTREYSKSDLEQALFDSNNRKSKSLIRRKSSTTESTPSKVIYSNFFEASTLAMTAQPQVTTWPSVVIVTPSVTAETVPVSKITPVFTRKSFSVSKRPKLATSINIKVDKQNKIDKTMPVTSQSYLTSISYEVNKRKKSLKDRNENVKPENSNKDERQTMMNRMDAETNLDTTHVNSGKQEDRNFDNDFALRLVNHAKGAAYLDKVSSTSASTIDSTSPKTNRKSKYTRRRSYVPRTKTPNRKKLQIERTIDNIH